MLNNDEGKTAILQAIIGSIHEDAKIREIRRGLHWTAVAGRFCGLASTAMTASSAENHEETSPLSLTDMTALELAQFSFSDDTVKASLGLAAVNSLIEIDESRALEINAGDILLQEGRGKNISLIGHFPFTDALRAAARNLWVIERRQRSGDYPEGDAETYLPKSDIVAISGATLVNHTLQGLLTLCPKNSFKVLLGPTTPMSEVLFDWGIDVISGSRVIDEKVALKYISEGANFRQLKRTGAVRLLIIRKTATA